MHDTLFIIMNNTITPWHVVGLLGSAMFTSRWLFQAYSSIRSNKSILPHNFWILSALGSVLLVIYFTFGYADPIGIVSNLFPLLIAIVNIYLIIRSENKIIRSQ